MKLISILIILVIIIIILFVAMLWILGVINLPGIAHISFSPSNNSSNPQYESEALLSLSTSTISLNNDQISNAPEIISLQKINGINGTAFTIFLNSSNATHVYAVYFNGSRVTEMKSPLLYNNEPYSFTAFKVFGSLPYGYAPPGYATINATLYLNGKLIQSKIIRITIN
jgi:hypothetical protein